MVTKTPLVWVTGFFLGIVVGIAIGKVLGFALASTRDTGYVCISEYADPAKQLECIYTLLQ